MGLFDFVKSVGKKIGIGDDEPECRCAEERARFRTSLVLTMSRSLLKATRQF